MWVCVCLRAGVCARVICVHAGVCLRAGVSVCLSACRCISLCVCKLCTIRQGILTKGKGDESHFISFHGLNVDKSQEMINLNLYF